MFGRRQLLAAPLPLGLGACVTRQTGVVAPGADLRTVRSIYVVRFEPDTRGVNGLIANDLRARGFQATTGDAIDRPPDVDAVLSYRDRWRWDISMYMLALDVTVADARTRQQLASGQSYRTSLGRLSPEGMVQEVMDTILAATPGVPATAVSRL